MSSASTTVSIQQPFLDRLATIKEKYEKAKMEQITGDRLTNITRFEKLKCLIRLLGRCVRTDAAYDKNDPAWVELMRLILDFCVEVYEFVYDLWALSPFLPPSPHQFVWVSVFLQSFFRFFVFRYEKNFFLVFLIIKNNKKIDFI